MKKVMIFIPHQDDEINLVGNILSWLVERFDTYIIYSSLPADIRMANVRRREAIRSCSVYGISDDHIYFLGYPDTSNKTGHHFFTDGDKSVVDKLEKMLRFFKPAIIFGTDFDYHSDHRMLSIALDEAVKRVLYDIDDYHPRYLKGFCYETAYYGVDDYSATNLGDTAVKNERLSNISYRWDERISIKSKEKNGLIFNKKAFKALKCHKSQYAVLHARSIINADNVFWEKRTDNLLLNKGVKITATSGDVSKLNDFKIIDTDDVITIDQTELDYGKGVWKAEENKAEIRIYWPTQVSFDRIVFHGHPNNKEDSNMIISIMNGHGTYIASTDRVLKQGRPTEIQFQKKEENGLIIICENYDGPIELSEIEILNGKSYESSIKVIGTGKTSGVCRILDWIDRIIYSVINLEVRIKRKLKTLFS